MHKDIKKELKNIISEFGSELKTFNCGSHFVNAILYGISDDDISKIIDFCHKTKLNFVILPTNLNTLHITIFKDVIK